MRGLRVIYYWVVSFEQVYMLTVNPRSEQKDLTPLPNQGLEAIGSRRDFVNEEQVREELVASVRQAGAIRRGEAQPSRV